MEPGTHKPMHKEINVSTAKPQDKVMLSEANPCGHSELVELQELRGNGASTVLVYLKADLYKAPGDLYEERLYISKSVYAREKQLYRQLFEVVDQQGAMPFHFDDVDKRIIYRTYACNLEDLMTHYRESHQRPSGAIAALVFKGIGHIVSVLAGSGQFDPATIHPNNITFVK